MTETENQQIAELRREFERFRDRVFSIARYFAGAILVLMMPIFFWAWSLQTSQSINIDRAVTNTQAIQAIGQALAADETKLKIERMITLQEINNSRLERIENRLDEEDRRGRGIRP